MCIVKMYVLCDTSVRREIIAQRVGANYFIATNSQSHRIFFHWTFREYFRIRYGVRKRSDSTTRHNPQIGSNPARKPEEEHTRIL